MRFLLAWPLLGWLTLGSARYPALWWPLALLWCALMLKPTGLRKYLLACPAAALLGFGPLRPWLMYYFKLGQIERGRLAYYEGWGWVDERHRLPDVIEALKRPGAKSFVHTSFGDVARLYELRIRCPDLPPEQAWAVVKTLAETGEAWEASLPWWTGAGWSAYEADDLPSSYFEIYQQAHPDFQPTRLLPEQSCRLWQQQGMRQIRRLVRDDRDFMPADPALEPSYRELMDKLRKSSPECHIDKTLRWKLW